MKTVFFSFAILLATTFAAKAQITGACDIVSITTEFVSSTASTKFPGKCDVKMNISWEQDANNGNKFSYFHIWQANTYQTFGYSSPSSPPSLTDLSATVGTIIVKDPSSSTPVLFTTYNPDASYGKVLPFQGYSSLVLRKTTTNNIDRFTVENVVLAGVDCNANGVYKFMADVWSSQQSSGKNVQCVSQGNPFSVNEIVDRSSVNCTNGTLQLQLLSTGAAASGKVNVYADLNTFGKFDPSSDFLLSTQNFTTGTSAALSGAWPYKFLNTLALPAAYRQSNLWIQIVPTGGKATQVFSVTSGCAPLPENLSYFTAVRTKNNVSLKWETVNEQVTKGFAVQRKTDGGWEQIAFVPTNAPGGNSSTLIAYQFNDVNSFRGVSQYQVVEVTANGKQKTSEIRAVRGESQSGRITVYPNPSNSGTVNIVFEQSALRDVVLSDMTGRVVKQFSNTSDANILVENLHDGFYTVRITDRSTNETVTQKVIVNKR